MPPDPAATVRQQQRRPGGVFCGLPGRERLMWARLGHWSARAAGRVPREPGRHGRLSPLDRHRAGPNHPGHAARLQERHLAGALRSDREDDGRERGGRSRRVRSGLHRGRQVGQRRSGRLVFGFCRPGQQRRAALRRTASVEEGRRGFGGELVAQDAEGDVRRQQSG